MHFGNTCHFPFARFLTSLPVSLLCPYGYISLSSVHGIPSGVFCNAALVVLNSFSLCLSGFLFCGVPVIVYSMEEMFP